jgi:hypothetical protein
MTDTASAAWHRALAALLGELIDGSASEASWILNPEDPGLRRSLETLPASAASVVPAAGGSSVAAHVDHLCYGLELLNRWSRGEDPFADANYSASWRRSVVSDTEWAALRDRLWREAHAWMENIRNPRPLSEAEVTNIVSSVAHLAYHFGAIRQIDRSTRGPLARD